jgi:hypothetical protein
VIVGSRRETRRRADDNCRNKFDVKKLRSKRNYKVAFTKTKNEMENYKLLLFMPLMSPGETEVGHFTLGKEHRNPMNRRLGGSQSRCACLENGNFIGHISGVGKVATMFKCHTIKV